MRPLTTMFFSMPLVTLTGKGPTVWPFFWALAPFTPHTGLFTPYARQTNSSALLSGLITTSLCPLSVQPSWSIYYLKQKYNFFFSVAIYSHFFSLFLDSFFIFHSALTARIENETISKTKFGDLSTICDSCTITLKFTN